jgi:cobalt-zinc-cadmium efflux system outer membrane protein
LSGGELGVLTEREGSARRNGASAGVALPLFSQGQGAVARAEAEVQAAQARVQAIEVAIDADLDTQLEQLTAAREEYTQYREQLIPQREAVVARLTEQANFMLASPFDLLLARQQSYAAYEGAVTALQSWWQGRIALTRALGAPFPVPAKE